VKKVKKTVQGERRALSERLLDIILVLMTVWTVSSHPSGETADLAMTALSLLPLLAINYICGGYEKRTGADARPVRIAVFLSGLSTSIAYSYGLARSALVQNMLCFFFFVLAYFLAIRSDRLGIPLYRIRIVRFLAVPVIPFLLFLARLSPQPEAIQNEAFLYIKVAGRFVMVLPLLLLLSPMAFASLMSVYTDIPFLKKRGPGLALGQVLLLFLSCLIVFLAAANNEFGTAIMIAGLAVIIFILHGRNLFLKLVLTAVGLAGSGFLMLHVRKIQLRVGTWLHMSEALTGDQQSREAAEGVGYLLQSAPRWGLLGMGPGVSYKSFLDPAFFTSDYIYGVVLANYGLILGLMTAFFAIYMSVCILKTNVIDRYDRTCNDVIGLQLLMMALLCIGGDIGSLPLTGLGFPFLSLSKSINAILYCNLAICLVIRRRGLRGQPGPSASEEYLA